MTCRVCQTETIPWLDLGEQRLANGLWDSTLYPENPLRKYPLAVERCPTCGLSQLTYIVPPTDLFTQYPYRTGILSDYTRHLRDTVIKFSWAGYHGPALDVASNDGTFVAAFLDAGVGAIGVEPSQNLSEWANEHGRPTRRGYFPSATSDFGSESQGIITAFNVLAHVNDVHGVVDEVVRLLCPDGVWVVEVPWLRDLLWTGAFDTIYHEHLSYWSLTALVRLAHRHGLLLSRCTYFAHHGGTIQAWFTKTGPETAPWPEPTVFSPVAYAACKTKMYDRIERWWSTFLTTPGRWVGYGAAAKGSVFAQAAGITDAHLEYVVDESPDKQNLRTAYGVPIVGRDVLDRDPPDNLVIFPWNVAEEIKAKIPQQVKVVTTE